MLQIFADSREVLQFLAKFVIFGLFLNLIGLRTGVVSSNVFVFARIGSALFLDATAARWSFVVLHARLVPPRDRRPSVSIIRMIIVLPSHVACLEDLSYLGHNLVCIYVLAEQVLSYDFSPEIQFALLLNLDLAQRKIQLVLVETICGRALQPKVHMLLESTVCKTRLRL